MPRNTVSTQSFGLVAWLESTRVALPLKGVECRFAVTAGVSSVEIDQIYHQEQSRPLDCTYTFPLPDEAAVYRCELHINGRVIKAIVREQEAAREIFERQKAAGRRAALVEAVRGNLFSLQLGNVQPGDVVVVRFAYFQTLDRNANELRLRVPVCPGERYIPGEPLLRTNSGRGTVDDTDQVPDASRLSPPRIDALHPDAAYFFIEGTVAFSDAREGSLSSPSHPVIASKRGELWRIQLAPAQSVPDQDFVLSWSEPEAQAVEPRAWKTHAHDLTYALIQLRAPKDAPVAANLPRDVYFLVDRSGSMEGAKWSATCTALRAFVDLLGSDDRVWITLFETSHQDFAEKPLPVAQLRGDKSFANLIQLGTGGGTELVPAAKHVLAKVAVHSVERHPVVIVITDGQVGNEREVLSTFVAQPGVPVFTFGIDTAVNDALLKRLAVQQGGACSLHTPDDDICSAISGLGNRLRRPVVTNLHLLGEWEGVSERLPDLYAGQTVDVSLRSANSTDEIVFEGSLADGRVQRFCIPLADGHNEALPLLWVRGRIARYEAKGERQDAIRLAEQFNLVCEGTAFVAWDEAEHVSIAHDAIDQPSLQCRGRGLKSMGDIPICGGWDTAASYGIMASCPAPVPTGVKRRSFSQPRNILRKLMARLLGRSDETVATLVRHGVHKDLALVLARWVENDQSRMEALTQLIADLELNTKTATDRLQRCREFLDQHLANTEDFAKADATWTKWAQVIARREQSTPTTT